MVRVCILLQSHLLPCIEADALFSTIGDMSRPIYRHLADKKWRARARLITQQRITQMSVIPDVLPSIDLTASVEMSYHGTKLNSSNRIIPRTSRSGQRVAVQPGEYVASTVAEQPPKLDLQVFNKGERLVTCLLYTSPSPRDGLLSRMPSSA